MKNIVVVGYPKSGNTWVTRLTAELVGCPVIGSWKEPENNEIAREGFDRQSNFRCFKCHHELGEIGIEQEPIVDHIIYVIRDPRDIVISGASYFKFNRSKVLKNMLSYLPKGSVLYQRFLYRVLYPERYRINQMVQAVLFGREWICFWYRVPWKEHIKPYLDSNAFFVKYEDMLNAPNEESHRILDYLNLERSDEYIAKAIYNQSFAQKKAEFLNNGNIRNANFMRIGRSEQWKTKFSRRQKNLFIDYLSEELESLGYDL